MPEPRPTNEQVAKRFRQTFPFSDFLFQAFMADKRLKAIEELDRVSGEFFKPIKDDEPEFQVRADATSVALTPEEQPVARGFVGPIKPRPSLFDIGRLRPGTPGLQQAGANAIRRAIEKNPKLFQKSLTGDKRNLNTAFLLRRAFGEFVTGEEGPVELVGGIGGFLDEALGEASFGQIPSQSSQGKEVPGSSSALNVAGGVTGFVAGGPGSIARKATQKIGGKLVQSIVRGSIEGAFISDPAKQISDAIEGKQTVTDAVANIGIGASFGAVLDPLATKGVPILFKKAKQLVKKTDELSTALNERKGEVIAELVHDAQGRTSKLKYGPGFELPVEKAPKGASIRVEASENPQWNHFLAQAGLVAGIGLSIDADEFGNVGYNPGTLTSGLTVGAGIGLLVSRGRSRTMGAVHKVARDIFIQSQKRFTSSAGKVFVRKMNKQAEIAHNLWGEAVENISSVPITIGGKTKLFRNWGRGKQELIADMIEAGEIKGFSTQTRKVIEGAAKSGVSVAGFTKDYFPKVMKPQIREDIVSDLQKMAKGFTAQLKEQFGGNEKEISKFVQAQIRLRGMKQSTTLAIEHLVKTGQAKSYFEAVVKLEDRALSDIFQPFGNLEKKRVLDLPKEFYDRNAKEVLFNYTKAAGERTADVRIWGKRGEAFRALQSRMSSNEAQDAQLLLKMSKGQLNRDPAYAAGPDMKRLADAFTGFQVTTKIASGYGTLLNVSQSFISTFREAGWIRGFQGVSRLLKKSGRELSRRSGGIMDQPILQLTGERPGGVFAEVADVATTVSGFRGINRLNQYVAASTGEVFVKDLHKLANKSLQGSVFRRDWARKKLNDFGINHKSVLTDEKIKNFMYRFATDTQLQKNVMADPIAFNLPKWRTFFLFKRFGYRQWVYTKDQLTRELSRGNVLPILRLGAGGYVGGETVIWAKNEISNFLQDANYNYRKSDPLSFRRLIEDIAAVGSAGFVTDMIDADDSEDIVQSILFAATPVLLSDAGKVASTAIGAGADIGRGLPLKDVGRRAFITFSRALGSLPSAASKRLQSEKEIKRRLDFYWGDERKEILDLFIDGKNQEARDRIDLWNDAFPEKPFKNKDVNNKEVNKRIRRKKESATP